jgi:hypothetical protein
VELATFNDYLTRFNAQDPSAFDTYIAPDVHVQNGNLHIHGADAMRGMYAQIWQTFTEQVSVSDYLNVGDSTAVRMHAHFTVLADNPASPLGPVTKGETFDFRGLVLYRIADGRFTEITVAYNNFIHTDTAGAEIDRGIPY